MGHVARRRGAAANGGATDEPELKYSWSPGRTTTVMAAVNTQQQVTTPSPALLDSSSLSTSHWPPSTLPGRAAPPTLSVVHGVDGGHILRGGGDE